MQRIIQIAFCLLGVTATTADTRIWHFDNDPPGKMSAHWSAAKTGAGPGSEWKIVEDATAPSGRRVLAQTSSAGPDDLFNLCIADDTDARDVDLSVKFKAVEGKNDRGGGLVWRYRDADNYYIARMNPLEDNFRVYKVDQGKRSQFQSADIKIPTGQWHVLRVVHIGDHIRGYLDGRLLLDVTDNTFAGPGRIGLWTKSDAVTYFDDLQLATPPVEAK